MRLLNVRTQKLDEFDDDSKLPPYAILSHTWDHHEVTFSDMHLPDIQSQQRYSKISLTCHRAWMDGYKYVWIDTCCIDKTSSAELSEAVNSMYSWYYTAGTCYAYLTDVESLESNDHPLEASKWFTRGWTLQELLASDDIGFFGRDFKFLDTKLSLVKRLSKITGIDEKYLVHRDWFREASIARRMSWAARRETTRVEDLAYCLLGIFDVNMPLIYGEGRRSFVRFQEELMKESDDQSLFAWGAGSDPDEFYPKIGLLSYSPKDFMSCRNITPSKSAKAEDFLPTTTSRGILLELPILHEVDRSLAFLACRDEGDTLKDLALELKQTDTKNIFYRVGPLRRVARTANVSKMHASVERFYVVKTWYKLIDFTSVS